MSKYFEQKNVVPKLDFCLMFEMKICEDAKFVYSSSFTFFEALLNIHE